MPDNSILEAAIDRKPLTIAPETTLNDAIELLSQTKVQISCLLVVEENRLQGVLTTKEIVNAIANETDLSRLKAVDLMKTDAIAVPSSELSNLNFVLRLFQYYRLQELVAIDPDTHSIGLLSALSLFEIIQPTNLLNWKTAGEVMTTKIVRADANSDAIARAKLMLEQNCDYLVIETSEGKNKIERIFTSGDLLCQYFNQNVYDRANASIQSLSCLHREDSLLTVHHKMRLYQKQSLAVIDETGEILGIVDRTALLSVLEPHMLYETIQAIQLFPQQFAQLQRQKIKFLERRHLEIEAQAQQAFSQLHQENSLLKTVLDNISAAVIVEDKNRQILYVNPEFCRLFDLDVTPKQLIGQSFSALARAISPFFAESNQWMYENNNSAEEVKGKNCLLENGTAIECDCVACPAEDCQQLDLDANERGYLWQFRITCDRHNLSITESKLLCLEEADTASTPNRDCQQLEIALANSQSKLSDILNHANAAISSFRLYRDLTIEYDYYSTASKQIFGYTAEELMSDPQLWYSRIMPEDLDKLIMPAFERIFAQETVTVEYRFFDEANNIRWIANTISSRRDDIEDCWIVTSYSINISNRKQAELALKESESMLSAVFERSAVGVALSDFNGKLLKTNPSFQEMLGYQEKELHKLHFSELTHHDDLVKSNNLFAELIQGKRDFFQIEQRYYCKNGEIIWVRNHVSVLVSHYKNSRLAIVFVENITENKQAELALQQLNEELELRVQERTQELTRSQEALQNQTNLLQTILDSIGDGLLVADTEGQFLIANPSAERILKIGSIDLSALTWSTDTDMYMSDRVTPYPSEQLPLYKAVRGEAIDDAEIFIPNPETLEGIWLSITSRPIIDRTGTILGGVLTFRNITERKLMEDTLRQRETEFRTLVENSPDIIARLDSQLRHLYINPAIEQISEISRTTIIGKTYRELDLPQDLVALLEESGRSVFATRQEKIIEFRLQTLKGEKYFRVRIVPELASDGTVCSILTISPDITTIKAAEAQIKASLKEKEVLLKEIHHRVKNNLYVVASLLEMQNDSLGEAQIAGLFEDSQQRIYSMALIHEKLYRSQNLAQINFGDYLEDLVTNLFASYNLQEKRIQLSIKAESIYLNIETATPCGLIVNELVSNTIKHAFPDNREGNLQVEFYRDCVALPTEDRQQNLNLIVSDNGIGFPEDLDFKLTNSMGFQVICTLTEQLEATIQLNRTNGTTFLLQFRELHYNKRF
jgi:PAS domain S-box-containing protein